MRRIRLRSGILYELLKYAVAILAVMVLGIFLIRLQGQDVRAAGWALVYGAFGNMTRIGNTVRWITPCLLTGISAAVAFRAGIWNMGIGGQLYMGAFAATMVALYCPMPAPIYPFVCMLVGGIFGLLWATIPALLKRYLNVSEMITTLMLNYVATLLTTYLTKAVNQVSSSNNSKAVATPLINEDAQLTNLIPKTNASTGVFVAIIIVLVVYFAYRYMVVGYEMRMVGSNIRFAKAGGVKTNVIFMSIFMVSGFVAGLAGAIEILGVYGKFTADFSSNMGWDGIMIATIAMYDPLATGFVGILWAAIKAGSLYMEATTETNRLTVEIIQSAFVLFVTINYFSLLHNRFRRFQKVRQIRREDGQNAS